MIFNIFEIKIEKIKIGKNISQNNSHKCTRHDITGASIHTVPMWYKGVLLKYLKKWTKIGQKMTFKITASVKFEHSLLTIYININLLAILKDMSFLKAGHNFLKQMPKYFTDYRHWDLPNRT